jgi:hypothetical protein
MKGQFSLVASFLLAGSPALGAEPEPTHVPNAICKPATQASLMVTLRGQETEQWCWAASGQMVMEYLGKSVDQCSQANSLLHRSDCCTSPTPDACIKTGWPQFDQYGFEFTRIDSAPLTWDQIEQQLSPKDKNNTCSFTPFAFAWRYNGGNGHMMVAIGYYTAPNGDKYIIINDPLPLKKGRSVPILYESYIEVVGDHKHWATFDDIRIK